MSRHDREYDLVYENGKYKAFACLDEGADNPFDMWDQLGTMAFKPDNHWTIGKDEDRLPRYLTIEKELTDEEGAIFYDDVDVGITDYMEQTHDAQVVVPLEIYSPSSCFMMVKECSEENADGCIYISKKKFQHEYGEATPEQMLKVREYMLNEIETYNQWGNGEVYGWVVFNMEENPDMEMLDQVDSCWGYYGYDHKLSGLLESAKESVEFLVREDIKNTEAIRTDVKQMLERCPKAKIIYLTKQSVEMLDKGMVIIDNESNEGMDITIIIPRIVNTFK